MCSRARAIETRVPAVRSCQLAREMDRATTHERCRVVAIPASSGDAWRSRFASTDPPSVAASSVLSPTTLQAFAKPAGRKAVNIVDQIRGAGKQRSIVFRNDGFGSFAVDIVDIGRFYCLASAA